MPKWGKFAKSGHTGYWESNRLAYVQSAVESERGRDGGDDLGDQSVQVCVRRIGQLQAQLADVVDGLKQFFTNYHKS